MTDEHPPIHHVERSVRATRILAIRQLLIDKGVVTAAEVDDIVARAQARTPADGATVVAKAWTDAAFKERLLDDARAAVAELGYRLSHDAELAVVENTADVHHLVVCTLCSCYPTSLLGPAAGLVQELRVPPAGGGRTARRTARVRPRTRSPMSVSPSSTAPRTCAISSFPAAPAGDASHGRGSAREPRHPRQHDRRRRSACVVTLSIRKTNRKESSKCP